MYLQQTINKTQFQMQNITTRKTFQQKIKTKTQTDTFK